MPWLLLGVDVASLRRRSDEFMVALGAHDFRGVGEADSALAFRHSALWVVNPWRGSLDSKVWYDCANNRAGGRCPLQSCHSFVEAEHSNHRPLRIKGITLPELSHIVIDAF